MHDSTSKISPSQTKILCETMYMYMHMLVRMYVCAAVSVLLLRMLLFPCYCCHVAVPVPCLPSSPLQARLTTPFLGEAEIVPPHVLSLDRTQCNHRNFVTVSGPLPATLPTQSSTKSDICQALYGVVRDHYMKPFTCYARSPCDTGIRCILEILDTMYSITLSFSRGSTAISLLVEDGMGVSLSYPESAPVQNSNGSTTIVSDVQLSVPQNSNLSLTQTYQPETSTIGFQVKLCVYGHIYIMCLCTYNTVFPRINPRLE